MQRTDPRYHHFVQILREELGRNFYEELELEKVTVRAEIMRRE